MRIRVLIVALITAGVLIPATLILTQQRASAANMVSDHFSQNRRRARSDDGSVARTTLTSAR